MAGEGFSVRFLDGDEDLQAVFGRALQKRDKADIVRKALRAYLIPKDVVVLDKRLQDIEAEQHALADEKKALIKLRPSLAERADVPEPKDMWLAKENAFELLCRTEQPTPNEEPSMLVFFKAYRQARRGRPAIEETMKNERAEIRNMGFKDVRAFAEAVMTAYNAVLGDATMSQKIPDWVKPLNP